MSLSTLLEAAKYLDYLDANPQQSQEQRQQSQNKTQSPNQHEHSQHQAQPTGYKKSSRRQKSSKKDAANTMLAMSLPSSKAGAMQMHQGVPIPMTSAGGHYHQGASLSSSFTESPLSSFASTALLCSKASGVTSASSSAASSLSSSDSSSSCGEIMMGDNDFGQSPPSVSSRKGGNSQLSHSLTHQQQLMSTNNNQRLQNKFGNSNQSFAHYIAATSAGPQLVTMTTPSSTGMTSASAPIDGRIRAGHVIHAATNNGNVSGSPFDSRHYSIATTSGLLRNGGGGGDSYGQLGTSLGATADHLGSPPMIMARVQPMILNSISPSAHQSIMAFQQQTMTASSPTSSTSSYSRHRELHKTLEKNRRAHLRHCFELLKTELPASDCVDKKTSHINIIKSAIRYVLALRQQECEIDNELQRLTRVKNELTEKLSKVRNEQQQQQQQQQQQVIVDSKMQGIIDPSSLSPALSSQQQQQAHHNSQPASPPSSSSATVEMKAEPSLFNNQQQQQPAAEQQLSFLLSQSKID